MKKIILMTTVLAAAFAVNNAFAQNTATGTGTAKAKIVAPVEITETSALNFGTIANDKAGNVSVDTAGARTGSATLITDSTNAPAAGALKITGPAGVAVTLQALPVSATVKDQNGSGTNEMTVSNFTSNPAPGSLTIPSTGTPEVNLAVGATLDVAKDQPEGDYSGQYDVSVTY